MAEQGLSNFVIDAKSLPASGKRMSEIVKMKVLDLGSFTCSSSVFLEGPDIIPTPKHSAIGERGERIARRPQG